MKNAKLLELIGALSRRELTRLGEYLDSPFFNKHEGLCRLGHYLIGQAPDFKSEAKLRRERIFEHLYPNKPFDENLLYSLFSKLQNLVYDFLIQIETEQQPRERNIYLLRALRERESEKHFQTVARQFDKLPCPPTQDQQYLEEYAYYRELDLQFILRGIRRADENLQLKSRSLDLFFLIEKLKIACDMASRNTVIHAHYDCSMLEELLHYLQRDDAIYHGIPILEIYISIWNILTKPEQAEHYQRLIQQLAQHYGDFTLRDAMSMYRYALNYCIRQINNGQANYFREALSIYQFLLQTKIILYDGHIAAWDYKNIVTTALRLNEHKWAEQFIEEYHEYLPNDIRENAYRYNLAALHYSAGKHDKALQALHNIEFTDGSYYMGAKIIQLKSYYELEESEPLYSLVEAFKTYLRRTDQVSDYQKQAMQHFLKIVLQLQKLRDDEGYVSKSRWQERLTGIKKNVEELRPLANKDWIEKCLLIVDC